MGNNTGIELHLIKAILEVVLGHVDGPMPWVGMDNLVHNSVKGLAKNYGFLWGEPNSFIIDAIEGIITDEPWMMPILWNRAGWTQAQILEVHNVSH